MSELKAFDSERIYWAVEQVEQEPGDIDNIHLDDNLFYIKSEVDTAITELKARIHELESIPHTDNSAVIERLSNENERLKAKLESVQATAYAESVDAGMENRRLKRALWLARAAFCARSCEYLSGISCHCYIGQEELYKKCELRKEKYLKAFNKIRAKAKEYL